MRVIAMSCPKVSILQHSPPSSSIDDFCLLFTFPELGVGTIQINDAQFGVENSATYTFFFLNVHILTRRLSIFLTFSKYYPDI